MAEDPRRLTDDEQRAWRSYVFGAQQIDAALDRQLQRDAGMPHAYYGILTVLVEAGVDGLRMSDLARAMRFSPSRLAHAMSSMERSGWVERHECRTDRRGQIAAVTPAGAAVQRAAAPGHVALVRELAVRSPGSGRRRSVGAVCSTRSVGGRAQAIPGPSPNS